MDKNLVIAFYGILLLVGNISGGYRLDEQLNYPHDNKHSIAITKRRRKYLFLIDKRHKRECLRAAYIQEMAGYIEFLISIIITTIFMILNIKPVAIIEIIIFTVFGIDELYTMIVYFYYRIKYK